MQQAASEDLLPKRDPDLALLKRFTVMANAKITEHSLDYVYELRRRVSRFVSSKPLTLYTNLHIESRKLMGILWAHMAAIGSC